MIMLNTLVEFKNTVMKKFGPILGTILLALAALAALAVLGYLVKTFIKTAIGLAIAALVFFGGYKAYEALSKKRSNT